MRYGRGDYWIAYATTFMTKEQVIIASTNTVRINSYQQIVAANDKKLARLQVLETVVKALR